ncbi:2Fe-2S iron-sulfur cluster-binding protein [Streptomyces chattanoogensis]
MSNDHHTPQQPHPEQGWQPLPQGGEYEQEATAFVQLPEGFTTGGYRAVPGYNPPGTDPLAAPGHGYTPPSSFTRHTAEPPVPDAGTDPAATGQWTMPFADPSAGYADPSAGYPAHTGHTAHTGDSGHSGHPGHQDAAAVYQGGAPGAAQPWGGNQVDWPVAGSAEATGAAAAWSVPAAADDVLEESGEYLVGDDGLTGHQGHAGHGAADYQGGGYQDTYGGAEVPADSGAADRTGHWNLAAGLSATTGAPGQDEAAAGPYATESSPAGGGEPADGAPYGTAAGQEDAPADGATGHWSLPADALAQWPPAPQEEAPRPEEAAPSIGAGPGAGAEQWAVPAAEGEQPDHSGEFAITPAPEAGAEAGADAVAGDTYGSYEAYQAYEEPPAAAGEERHPDGGEHGAQETDAGAAVEPDPEAGRATAGPEAEGGTVPAPSPVDGVDGEAQDAPLDVPVAAGPGEQAEPTGQTGLPAEPADAAGLTGPAPDGAALAGHPHDEHPTASYVLRVNGTDRPVTDSWIGESLLYVLRERLGLAGAKDGCSQGECGACSVQVDGRLVASCLVPAATTAGSDVRTVEGLAQDGVPSDVQRALAASGAVQCGFCIPGMAMTVHDLLEGNHAPSELETRKALCGNLCRCSGYRGVLDAVEEVVKARAEAAEAAHADETPPDTPAETPRIPHQAGPSDPTGHTPHHQGSPGHHPHQGPGTDSQTGGAA